MAYDYWWGYTAAQIELMAIDQPVVQYSKKDLKNSGVPSKKKMEDIAKKWEREKAGRKSYVGREVSLSELLSNTKEEDNGK